MMAGERTPLLLRSSRNISNNNSNRNRQRGGGGLTVLQDATAAADDPYGHLATAAAAADYNESSQDDDNNDHLFLPVRSSDAADNGRYHNHDNSDRHHQRRQQQQRRIDDDSDDNDKEDRRGWSFGRMMGSFIAQQINKGTSLVVRRNSTSFLGGSGYYNEHAEIDDTDDDADEAETTVAKSWKRNNCVFGTHPGASIWWNAQDRVGCLMAAAVWFLLGYSVFTVLMLATRQQQQQQQINSSNNDEDLELYTNNKLSAASAGFYCTVAALALASHAKTALTDPGSVPRTAIPPQLEVSSSSSPLHNSSNAVAQQQQKQQQQQHQLQFHSMCGTCLTYKPAVAHHCRICNRCISRMDHHCPWMNNCVGAANMKHFILFLLYTCLASATALVLFARHYLLCSIIRIPNNNGTITTTTCQFTSLEVHLVRVMTFLSLATLAFTTTVLRNTVSSIVPGVGTTVNHHRSRQKAAEAGQWETTAGAASPAHTFAEEAEESSSRMTAVTDVFGSAASSPGAALCGWLTVWWWWWLIPTDPVFDNPERVYGYTTTTTTTANSSSSRIWQQQQAVAVVSSSPRQRQQGLPLSPTSLSFSSEQHLASRDGPRRRHELWDGLTPLDI